MKSVAIVGSGIAGMACARFLHGSHVPVTVFEANDYVGGHTHTIDVKEMRETVSFDTGFMVYNEVTYPLLSRLFHWLNVPTKPTSMSFSVQHKPSGIEWNGAGFNTLFGQRRNLLRPSHWRFLMQLNRFNREAVAALEETEWSSLTLEEYVERRGYGNAFLERYLIPMSSAVWSARADDMLRFPAMTLVRFWYNHGFLGLDTQHPWRTVDGGAREYVKRLMGPLRDRVRLKSPVTAVRETASGVELETPQGKETFDQVILASHADQSLRMLEQPTERQRELLSPFAYQRNAIEVHTDARFMPRTERCWASWNYRSEHGGNSMHYWMNSLQGVSQRRNYFVSLNPKEALLDRVRQRSLVYDHPLFDLKAIEAQKRLPELNDPRGKVFFCGSYFGYGFHEDALRSAYQLCDRLLDRDPWESLV